MPQNTFSEKIILNLDPAERQEIIYALARASFLMHWLPQEFHAETLEVTDNLMTLYKGLHEFIPEQTVS